MITLRHIIYSSISCIHGIYFPCLCCADCETLVNEAITTITLRSGCYNCATVMSYIEINKAVSQWHSIYLDLWPVCFFHLTFKLRMPYVLHANPSNHRHLRGVSVWSGGCHNCAKNPSVRNEEQCTHYKHERQFLTSRAQGVIFNLIFISQKIQLLDSFCSKIDIDQWLLVCFLTPLKVSELN